LAAAHAACDGAGDLELPRCAAALCARLVRSRPLPDGNEAVALACTIELIRRNGRVWAPVADASERTAMVERLAAGTLTEHEFARWIEAQLG
jgi:prophage maintenance system killer protein